MVISHILFAFLSYAAFLIACVSGALFIVQERQVKKKHMGALFRNLPSLDRLERINVWAIGVGFGLLSIGLACGLLGERLLLGRWWTGDIKEYLTVAVWLSYLILLVVRMRATLRGRRVALLSVFGFTFLLMTFVGANWLWHSWHPYI